MLAAPVLALIGGLALACFVKVFGIAFLGEPRTAAAAAVDHDAAPSMRGPMVALLLACAWIGLLPGTVAPLLQSRRGQPGRRRPVLPAWRRRSPRCRWVGAAGWVLLVLLVAASAGGCSAARRGAPRDVATWGCGYAAPTPRMQYTASSFADVLVSQFRFGLWTERHGGTVHGLFPAAGEFASHTPDAVLDRVLLPGCPSWWRAGAAGCGPASRTG